MQLVHSSIPNQTDCSRILGRAMIRLPASILMIDGRENCWINDISLGGARIETNRLPEVREPLILRTEILDVFAMTIWAAGTEAGIRFDDKISKESLFHLRDLAHGWRRYIKGLGMVAARDWVAGR